MSAEVINGLFALGGALIGVIGSWIVARNLRETRRLTLFVSPIAKLLDVSDLVRSDVSVLYKNAPAEAIGAGELAVQNTGSKAIEDIEVLVQPDDDSPVFDLEIRSANFPCEEGFITISAAGSSQLISIPFLNQSDRLVLEYRVLGALSPAEVSTRLKDVDVTVRQEMISWLPDIYAEVIADTFSQIPGLKLALSFSRPFRLYFESKRMRT
ncbi:MAG: hypothetical protein AAFQ62_05030 [Pseudomonadota bacterium]